MNIVQSQIKAKKLSLHVNNLKGDNFQVNFCILNMWIKLLMIHIC